MQRRGRGNRVEILHHEVVHVRRIEAQRDFVQIAVFALHQVEQIPLSLTPSPFPHFALEQRRRDDHRPAVLGQKLAARDRRADFGVVFVAVEHPVLREDQHAARAAVARHARQEIGGAFHGFAPFADHVVQAEVQLVVGEHLLGLLGGLAGGVLVGFAVVELQTGEHGVVVAHIQSLRGQHDGLRFVGFQGRGDCDVAAGVAIQDVDEILLLDGTWDEKGREMLLIMKARPFGSTARYWPGRPRIMPTFPKVS